MSAAARRKAPRIIARASPLFALVATTATATSSYYAYAVYNSHDNRDLDAAEICKAHRSLACLDGRQRQRQGSEKNESKDANANANVNANVESESKSKSILRQHLSNLESSGATLIRSVPY